MPLEPNKRPTNRWEGTHTYARTDSTGKRARTAAQVREEALRRIKEDREKRIAASDRRRSLPSTSGATKGPSTLPGIPAENLESQGQSSPGTIPGSNKKKRHASARPEELPAGAAPPPGGAEGIDPALKAFLLSIKEDINVSLVVI